MSSSEHNGSGLLLVFGIIAIVLSINSLTLPKDLVPRTSQASPVPAQQAEVKKDIRVKYKTPLEYLGKSIDFDGNGKRDCFDVANQSLFDRGGNPPVWQKGGDNTDVFKLPNAKSIIKNHAVLMRGLDYTTVNNPNYKTMISKT